LKPEVAHSSSLSFAENSAYKRSVQQVRSEVSHRATTDFVVGMLLFSAGMAAVLHAKVAGVNDFV
jgi:hypothetical protein